MTVLRLLNGQGIAGLAASLCLALLLVLQNNETRHWKKQASRFEQSYRSEQAAHTTTVASYRAAAEAARAADKANVDRVVAEQNDLNERISNDFEARLAAARSVAQRLRIEAPSAAAHPRAGGTAAMSGLPSAAGGSAQGPDQDRLSPPDTLTATEQAIQLDELIKWVRAQAKVDNNAPTVASPPAD